MGIKFRQYFGIPATIMSEFTPLSGNRGPSQLRTEHMEYETELTEMQSANEAKLYKSFEIK